MQVPFNDLAKQNLSNELNLLSIVEEKVQKSELIGGQVISDFENAFSAIADSLFTASCANGTDALEIAFKTLDLGKGDEVIVPAQTWISTAEAVSAFGAKPIFCDTEDNVAQLIDTSKIEALITPKTKGIVPVHFQGRTANIQHIQQIAKKSNLWIVEDCAQAHLAKYNQKSVGSTSDFGTFSFYPGKNLGALGDAGAAICQNKEQWQKFKMIANHGALVKGDHQILGRNSRLDSIQAAVLLAKLPHLQKWTDKRRQLAQIYSDALGGVGDIEIPPKLSEKEDHVYHLYVIATKYRNELMDFLAANGISCGIHYKKAVVDLTCYRNNDNETCKNARKYQDIMLSLPLFPEMQDEQIAFVIKKIKEFF